MEQASAYSNLSRGPNVKSPTPSNNAMAHQSMATSITSPRSSKSVSPSSSIISSYGRAVSPPTNDGYDNGVPARGSRNPRAKSARKRRPAYLELQPEEPEDDGEDVVHRTRSQKDYLRRSSPTVAENFKFIPGVPPPKMPSNDAAHGSVATSADGYEYPLSAGEYMEPSTLDDIEQSIDALTEEIAGTPSPPVDRLEESEYPDGGHRLQKQQSSSSVRSQVITLPQTARLRKQASRERVLHSMQEETQDRNGQFPLNQLQYGSTGQLAHLQRPPQTGPPKVPPPPVPQQGSGDQKSFVQHGMYPPRHPFTHQTEASDMHPPRMHSLNRQSQQQATVDRFNQNRSQPLNGYHAVPQALRPRRSASDAQRQQNIRFPMPPQREEDEYLTLEEPLASPEMPASANSDSWPLSQEISGTSQHSGQESRMQDNSGSLLPDNNGQHDGYPHSRNMSQASQGSQVTTKSYDLINTPRQSRSGTPSYGTATIYTSISTPRTTRSSGTGTLATVRSDETSSTTGSVAPSVLSAQWYRNPRERQGLGPRISHSEPLPWELGAEDGELEHLQQVGDKSKGPVFSVFPRDLSRKEREQQYSSMDQHSESPLMSEKFPVDVKESPEAAYHSKPRSEAETSQSSSTETKSRAGASTPARELLDLGGSKKPKKPKKDNPMPSLREMIKEYKGMTSKWYVEQYKADERDEIRELDIHQNRSHSSQATRPSTGSSNVLTLNKATPSSMDLEPHQESPFEQDNDPKSLPYRPTESLNKIHVDRTVTQVVAHHPPPEAAKRPTSPPPKSSGNVTTRGHVSRPSGETVGSDKSSSRGSRMSLDGKSMGKKNKKQKKPGLLGELLKEYKEMTNAWYASPYGTEPARSSSPSTSRS